MRQPGSSRGGGAEARDSRERFTRAAASYDLHRPTYPPELVDWIVRNARIAPPARIADIGSGSGIATRLWQARGFDAIGVEPNEAMLEVARAMGGSFRRGDATATGLEEEAFDLVTAAQAFHYFPVEATLAEWRRVLRPGGACAIFWYRISPSPVKSAFRTLRRRFGVRQAPYVTRKGDILRVVADRSEVVSPRWGVFRYDQWLDHDGWCGRVLASSRMHVAQDDPELWEEVDAIFDRCQVDGRMRVPLEALALTWRFS